MELLSGETYDIREFRTNKCWDWTRNCDGAPYSADIAIMVLDRPIPNAVLGEDYVNIWNAETMESVAGRDFILAGWGSSGELREDGSTDHHGIEIFHRGYNNVNEIRNNMLVYTMDQNGLPLEAMGHSGDSGSGAFIDIDGTLLIAGVKSNGEGATWGSENEYTRVGGIA